MSIFNLRRIESFLLLFNFACCNITFPFNNPTPPHISVDSSSTHDAVNALSKSPQILSKLFEKTVGTQCFHNKDLLIMSLRTKTIEKKLDATTSFYTRP